MEGKLKVIIAPLDWGLGHTTRCIPIIDFLLKSNCEVVVASERNSAKLLKENFPNLEMIPLKGYRINYSKHQSAFSLKIILQIPKIIKSIFREKKALNNIVKRRDFDLIISDNRYGFYHPQIPSVILTHQLQIQSGFGKISDYILKKTNYKLLNKFKECWIVDEQKNGLSGILAHPKKTPSHSKYIGLLSQMGISQNENEGNINKAKPYKKHILIILSGPEPMRGILENKLWTSLQELQEYEITFIAGNPSGKEKKHPFQHITYHSHLTGEQLKQAFHHADLVISRSGYSTLMDLAILQKKALLIPTPGQTEQEYLAKYLKDKMIFYAQSQNELSLKSAIEIAFSFPGFRLPNNNIHKQMQQAVISILKSIKSPN